MLLDRLDQHGRAAARKISAAHGLAENQIAHKGGAKLGRIKSQAARAVPRRGQHPPGRAQPVIFTGIQNPPGVRRHQGEAINAAAGQGAVVDFRLARAGLKAGGLPNRGQTHKPVI